MAEMQDSWKDVASKAEALGLKLKLHLEQEKDAAEPREPGDTKALLDDLGAKLTDAFDSMGNAAKDTAVHDDVKDMGRLFKDALMVTINTAGEEVGKRTGSASDADPGFDASAHEAAVVELDEATGDESGDGDS